LTRKTHKLTRKTQTWELIERPRTQFAMRDNGIAASNLGLLLLML